MKVFLLLFVFAWAPIVFGAFPECPRDLATPVVEVHVRRLPDPDTLVDNPLSWDERTVASRFLSITRRREYIAARTVLREILGRYLGLLPKDVPLVVPPGRESQKPYVAAEPPFSFNMSHSGERVAIAVWRQGRGFEVGVDLEKRRPLEDIESTAPLYFTERERRLIFSADDRAAEFLRLWTLKEAYVKALGTGLVGKVNELSILERPDAWLDQRWLDADYLLALAVTPVPAHPPRVQISTE